MDGDGFKRVSDDKSVDISKLPEDDKGLYYKDEPYTTKKLQQRLIITYSPKWIPGTQKEPQEPKRSSQIYWNNSSYKRR